jgi:hypothetical protein
MLEGVQLSLTKGRSDNEDDYDDQSTGEQEEHAMQVVLPRDLRSGLADFSKSAAACAMYDHHLERA